MYWIKRNKSDAYSNKLRKLFKITIKHLTEFPHSGSPTQIENIRVKVVRDYLIIYQILEKEIYILTIRDSRRNPDDLKLHLQLK